MPLPHKNDPLKFFTNIRSNLSGSASPLISRHSSASKAATRWTAKTLFDFAKNTFKNLQGGIREAIAEWRLSQESARTVALSCFQERVSRFPRKGIVKTQQKRRSAVSGWVRKEWPLTLKNWEAGWNKNVSRVWGDDFLIMLFLTSSKKLIWTIRCLTFECPFKSFIQQDRNTRCAGFGTCGVIEALSGVLIS
jgi:hypothetical protein